VLNVVLDGFFNSSIICLLTSLLLFNNLGNVAKALNRLTEAEQYYRQAIELRPDYAELYVNLGHLLKDSAKFSEAEIAYRNVLKIKPNYLKGYNHLPECFYQNKLLCIHSNYK
jgi:tetratricopeptide (TPR) repeat protein